MKKVLSLVLVLACVALMATASFAVTFAPAGDGTFSVPYTEGASGAYYALLVVEGVYEENETPVISEDTVLYIDQATADSNGDVSFDGWMPKNDNPATVYLGGSNLPGPVLLGYLGQSNFVVAGTVTTDSATSNEATITLADANGTVFTGTSVGGVYSVEVPAGTYTFTVNVKNHLSYKHSEFAVSADVSGKDVAVKGGDIDGDGKVAYADLAAVLKDYSTDIEEADINGDGKISYADLATILKNYGELADNE